MKVSIVIIDDLLESIDHFKIRIEDFFWLEELLKIGIFALREAYDLYAQLDYATWNEYLSITGLSHEELCFAMGYLEQNPKNITSIKSFLDLIDFDPKYFVPTSLEEYEKIICEIENKSERKIFFLDISWDDFELPDSYHVHPDIIGLNIQDFRAAFNIGFKVLESNHYLKVTSRYTSDFENKARVAFPRARDFSSNHINGSNAPRIILELINTVYKIFLNSPVKAILKSNYFECDDTDEEFIVPHNYIAIEAKNDGIGYRAYQELNIKFKIPRDFYTRFVYYGLKSLHYTEEKIRPSSLFSIMILAAFDGGCTKFNFDNLTLPHNDILLSNSPLIRPLNLDYDLAELFYRFCKEIFEHNTINLTYNKNQFVLDIENCNGSCDLSNLSIFTSEYIQSLRQCSKNFDLPRQHFTSRALAQFIHYGDFTFNNSSVPIQTFMILIDKSTLIISW
jgi:hypothetical protein